MKRRFIYLIQFGISTLARKTAVVSMFSNNIQYEITKPLGLKLVDGSKKQILNKTYTIREIDALVERKLLLTDLSNDS